MQTPKEQLAGALTVLADIRHEIEVKRAELQFKIDELNESQLQREIDALAIQLDGLQDEEGNAYVTVQNVAKLAYVPEEGKKLADGLVTVSDKILAEYDETAAIDWCERAMSRAINRTLKKRDFEKAARQLLESGYEDTHVQELRKIVTLKEVQVVSVSKDVSSMRSPVVPVSVEIDEDIPF